MSYEMVPSILGGPERALGWLPTDGRPLSGDAPPTSVTVAVVAVAVVAVAALVVWGLKQPHPTDALDDEDDAPGSGPQRFDAWR